MGMIDIKKKGLSQDLKELKEAKGKLKERIISRNLLRPSQMSVRIPEYHAPSILNDPNRFFKSEMEETKKSLFFS